MGLKSNRSVGFHSEMNCSALSQWRETSVFPKIAAREKSSVVVLVRATYHTVFDDEHRNLVAA